MTGGCPDLLVVDHRCRNLVVAVLLMNASPELQQGIEELPASGHPVGHARCCLMEHEEIQLRSQLLVITLLGLLQQLQELLQLCLVREGIDVDSLQLVLLLVSSPVGTGYGTDLEGHVHELLGILHMGSAAKIHIVITGIVNSDGLVRRHFLDQLCLELLSLEKLQCFLSGNLLAGPGLSSLDDLPHLVLDGLEIILAHGSRQHKIIVQSVLDLGSDGILYLRTEQLNHGLRQNMRHGMAVYL